MTAVNYSQAAAPGRGRVAFYWLERRIALTALCLVGMRPRTVIGGFMVTTAVLSM